MRHYAWLVLLWLAPVAAAEQPVDRTDQQRLGMRIFNQSCRVCHTKPQIISPQYAPALSMNTLGGKANLITEVISNGTPRMPGFKYQYKPDEIAAIAAYIQTIPVPAAMGAPASGKSNASRDAD
jgi:mono/diheme cytochrome c family protein